MMYILGWLLGIPVTFAEINPTQLAWGGWLVFLLFFVGAISSCIGATCGMRCKREDPLISP